jgi:glycerate 2-kinase
MTDTGAVNPIAGVRETVLVAPDSFKGTFTAGEVADAIGTGLREGGRPADLCPVADGGEGTLEALVAAMGGEVRTAEVSDPLGRTIEAEFALSGATAIVETAAASGLGLVPAAQRDAIEASTFGTGELLVAAAAAGADRILLGVGGSATTDGGAGAIRAIERVGGLDGVRVIVLCDVRTTFADAARVFGPQKGADPGDVRRLTARLNAQARRLPRDPRSEPMTGAAGGLSGGLWATLGAELVSGAAFVLDAVGFDARMRAARAVITGEGKLDEQSLVGKVISEVATRSRQAGVPCNAVVGTRELDAMGARVLDLERVLEATTLDELRDAGRELAQVL